MDEIPERVKGLEVAMDGIKESISEIKTAQNKILTLWEEQQSFIIHEVPKAKKKVFRTVSGKLARHKAEIAKELSAHQENCPVVLAERNETKPFSWKRLLQGLFAVGVGVAALISGFLYEIGVLGGGEKDEKPKQITMSKQEVKP